MGIVAGIVRDAIARQELTLPDTLSAEEFVFGFWAINYGSQILTFTSPSLPSLGINNPGNAIRIHCGTLLNGFQWQPMMNRTEYDDQMHKLNEQLEPRFWDLKNDQKAKLE